MRKFSFSVIAALLSGISAADAGVPTVDVGYATYQGTTNESLSLTTYYGIRYAQSPDGARRWKPPIPIETQHSPCAKSNKPVINATSAGPQCLQSVPQWALIGYQEQFDAVGAPPGALEALLDEALRSRPTSEDCLLLDVIVPTNPQSEKLPVVVSIHGGGYVSGSASTDPGLVFMTQANESIVHVAIQYRLGPLGFMSGSEIAENGSANAGLLDQRLALEWVQEHIHHFGGDPENVTIMGGSAGGGSVMNHLVWEGGASEPPFHAAIAEFPWGHSYHEEDFLERQYQDFLQAAGCEDLDCLRNVPFEEMWNITMDAYELSWAKGLYGYGDSFFGPVVDRKIIQGLPSRELNNGRFHQVPLLTDRESYEAFMFTNTSLSSWPDNSRNLKLFFPQADDCFLSQLRALYPEAEYSDAYIENNPLLEPLIAVTPSLKNNPSFFQFEALFSDYVINCPSYYMAKALSAAEVPVWKNVFHAGSGMHGAIAPYLFDPPGSTTNDTLATILQDYYLSFIIHHDPNGETALATEKPFWPRYSASLGGHSVLKVQEEGMWVAKDPEHSDRCRFFELNSGIVKN